MKFLFTHWNKLTDTEKVEVLFLVIAMLFSTFIIISVIAWSRGVDVEYYKERVALIENKLIVIDKRMLNNEQRTDRLIEYSVDTRHGLESEILRNNEQDKYFESTKSMQVKPKRLQPIDKQQ